MSQWIHVCDERDLLVGIGVCARVRDRQVAIFRMPDNQIFSIDNHDPFSDANVLSRGIVGDVNGEPVVASPVYKQHFSLASGQCLEDASVKLDTYEVKLLDGFVHVASRPSK